jgi:serine protease AprX
MPRTSNNVAAGILRQRQVVAAAPTGLGLTGEGEIVAVCDTGLDTGDAQTIHPDFAGRVVAIKSYPIGRGWRSYVTNPGADDGAADVDSGHGTHVAGSVLGDGSASANGPVRLQGMAPKARLVFQAVEQRMLWRPGAVPNPSRQRYALSGIPDDLEPLFRFAYDHGARIHNNSWGGGEPGAYDAQCGQFDDFVWRHKDMCFVIAAGNDGSDTGGAGLPADGRINPGSVTSPGTAKNCITVGASENLRPEFNSETYGRWWEDDFPVAPFKNAPMADKPHTVVAFSSRGPTNDGRNKPEVVAPGTFIASVRSTQLAPNNFAWGSFPGNRMYFHMGGTSMAAPLVAGCVALLRQYLRTQRQIASPSAALLKAVLIVGALRLPGTASAGSLVDDVQGFGRVDMVRSLSRLLAVEEGAPLSTGQMKSYSIQVARSGRTLRVALAYSDAPGSALVNNLNLIVIAPDGTRHVGNQGRGRSVGFTLDSRNNVEVVQVAKAAKGQWTVQVIASNVPQGPQDHALAAVLV